MSTLLERFHHRRDTLLDTLTLRTGSLRDYAVLKEHHYRAATPATATRVLVIEDRRPSVAGRYLCRPDETTTLAVLVESLASLSCRMRDYALHERYASLAGRSRSQLLNDELRCISRVVVDPRFRGVGLAGRLVRAALAKPTTRYTEALAAMGRVNPFFERAGMTPYHRPSHAYDLRLADALGSLSRTTHDLAWPAQLLEHIETLPDAQRQWFLRELRAWYRKNAGRSGTAHATPLEQLTLARERLKLEPVYYLHESQSLNRQDAKGAKDRQGQND